MNEQQFKLAFDKLDKYTKQVVAEQYPFAASLTANKAMSYARSKVVEAMDTKMKGGAMRWTKQGMKMYWTTKQDLTGGITFKKDRSYMRELMRSGYKKPREGSKSIAEPNMSANSKVSLNKYGNYPRNYLQKAMQQANVEWSSPVTKKTYRGINGYEIKPLKSKPHLKGLWQWRGSGKQRKPHLLVVFKRGREQRQTFDAPDIAQGNFIDFYQRNFVKYLMQAVSTAK